MGTFRNWAGRRTYVSTIGRTADATTRATRWATTEPAGSISCGICRTTFGRSWAWLLTHTSKHMAMEKTAHACQEEWRATTLTSGPCLFTIGELGPYSCLFPFCA